MGLDMYLYREDIVTMYPQVGEVRILNEILPEKVAAALSEIIPDWKVTPEDVIPGVRFIEIATQVGYWRKANAVHAWFVREHGGGKDECQRIYVDHDDLQVLMDACRAVLADPDKAAKVLPTQSGFFFGSTEYDGMYRADLESTVATLAWVMANVPEHALLFYQASW